MRASKEAAKKAANSTHTAIRIGKSTLTAIRIGNLQFDEGFAEGSADETPRL